MEYLTCRLQENQYAKVGTDSILTLIEFLVSVSKVEKKVSDGKALRISM